MVDKCANCGKRIPIDPAGMEDLCTDCLESLDEEFDRRKDRYKSLDSEIW